ncbi:MAG: hypothetical protein QM296_06815 [Bacillota bacterium]|nr:hypothetical protein [Bacillota bacterium]
MRKWAVWLRLALLLLLGVAVWKSGLLRYETWDLMARQLRSFLFSADGGLELLLGLGWTLLFWVISVLIGLPLGLALFQLDRDTLHRPDARRQSTRHALINIFVSTFTAVPLPLALLIALVAAGAGLDAGAELPHAAWIAALLVIALRIAAATANRLALDAREQEPGWPLGRLVASSVWNLGGILLAAFEASSILGFLSRRELLGRTIGLLGSGDTAAGLLPLLTAAVFYLLVAVLLSALLRLLARRLAPAQAGEAAATPPFALPPLP